MTPVADWKEVLTKAWSVRWIVAAALLSGLEVALPIIAGQLEVAKAVPPGAFAGLAALTSAGALIARVMAQPKADQ